MDKKLKILIGVLLVLLLLSPFVYKGLKKAKNETNYVITNDSLNFKQEYEKLNGTQNSNNQDYLTVELSSYVPVEYTTYDKIFEILENGSGVIYFGFPECPWCRNLTPVLASAAIDYGLDTIYYISNQNDRNTLSLNKKNKVVTDKKGTEEYNKLVDLLKDVLPTYRDLKDEKIKRLYFPTVLFVKDGEILGLEQSLSSYSTRVEGNPLIPMTNEEKQELTNIFTEYFKQIQPKKNQKK